jgi:hypothetical protein
MGAVAGHDRVYENLMPSFLDRIVTMAEGMQTAQIDQSASARKKAGNRSLLGAVVAGAALLAPILLAWLALSPALHLAFPYWVSLRPLSNRRAR